MMATSEPAQRPVVTFWQPTLSLCTRELKRFARQKSRVVGTLVSPLVFWLVLGLGMGSSFQAPAAQGMGYLEYFYPGTVLLIVLFTSIFSTISIIEDRREGFLQSVQVSPASPYAIALGKILGGTTVAEVGRQIFESIIEVAGGRPTKSELHGLGEEEFVPWSIGPML